MSNAFWNFISVVATIGSFYMFADWLIRGLIKTFYSIFVRK